MSAKKSEGSELVPIDVEVLRAAYDRARDLEPELTWHRVAQRIGTDHQRISAILRSRQQGRSRRCRRSLRDALAKELRVTPELLSGESAHLPFVIDDIVTNPFGTGSTWPKFVQGGKRQLPSAVSLVRNSFMEKVHRRLMEDLEKAYGDDAQREFVHWGNRLLIALTALIDPVAWQWSFIHFAQVPDPMNSRRAAVFAQTWEDVLSPWLKGDSEINVTNIFAVLRGQQSPFLRLAGDLDELEKQVMDLYKPRKRKRTPKRR